MIIKGTLNYDQHGRRIKRKSRSSSRSRTLGFHPSNTGSNPVRDTTLQKAKEHREKYPSMPIGEYTPPKDSTYKKEVSKNYTVSIAYNKGAYQVIPKDDVEHIGK